MMGLAQGLMKARAPSFTPKSFGSIAGDAGQGFISGYQNGLNNSVKLQQILMQRRGPGATYQALLSEGVDPGTRWIMPKRAILQRREGAVCLALVIQLDAPYLPSAATLSCER